MGLKSGSRDAGFDGEEEEQGEQAGTESEQLGNQSEEGTAPQPHPGERSDSEETQETSTPASDSTSDTPDDRPSMSSIPYKLRRDKVNEGREQVPYFLREEVIAREDELQATLEEELGENVYKSDYREAAMVVAQRNPELVADILREWGYDLQS